jgi:hypothetical protein
MLGKAEKQVNAAGGIAIDAAGGIAIEGGKIQPPPEPRDRGAEPAETPWLLCSARAVCRVPSGRAMMCWARLWHPCAHSKNCPPWGNSQQQMEAKANAIEERTCQEV